MYSMTELFFTFTLCIVCSTLCIYMIILQMNDGIYLMLPVPKAQRVMASLIHHMTV